MSNILLIYSTTDGHTIKICDVIRRQLESINHNVSMISIEHANQYKLTDFDKVILGASIRYGKHNKQVYQFIAEQNDVLNKMPSAFFSVNLVARKAEKSTPETNPYLQKFLTQINWQPKLIGMFAGKLDYQSYRFFDRQMIRFIMKLTKGPTDPYTNVEFTNWQSVENFANQISTL